MTIKEANSLKPCPFCGHTAILNTSTDGRYHWVSCTNDECGKCKSTKEEAMEAWNKRYDEKSLSEIYSLKGERKMTAEEKEKVLKALNYKDKNGEECKSNNDLWIPLFLLMFAMSGNQASNIQLEKEVAYLSGKVDTLEKIIISKGLMKDT